jgi:hypothetical protein
VLNLATKTHQQQFDEILMKSGGFMIDKCHVADPIMELIREINWRSPQPALSRTQLLISKTFHVVEFMLAQPNAKLPTRTK